MKKLFKAFGYPEVVWLQKSERSFLTFISLAFIIAMFATPYPQIAMWVGFVFAAYAAIANDSIQTIGTFIASNQDKKWWVLWLFLGGIFCSTMLYSWYKVDKAGLTLFTEKISETTDEKNLAFFANYSLSSNGNVERNKAGKLAGPSIEILNDPITGIISWSVNGQDLSGKLKYTDEYRNEDYGLCFYLDSEGNIYQISNLINVDSNNSNNVFNEYSSLEFINQETNNTEVISLDNIKIVLFGDKIPDGDVSHARLSSKGFEKAPVKFHFLQISAAIFLLILTRLRMPVSTTFILLTSFAASTNAVGKVLAKSFTGYIMSFILGLIFFLLIAKISKKYFIGKVKPGWVIAQWITSGLLWATWLTQDAANIAVFLPRSLSVTELCLFLSVIVIGLGILLYSKGGRIQKIVTEKSVVTDVRFATLIDLVYCVILFYFKMHSQVPMSTTWVFIGLLAGREIGMAIMNTGANSLGKSFKLAFKDVSFALIGLFISIMVAVGVNNKLSLKDIINEIPVAFNSGLQDFIQTIFG